MARNGKVALRGLSGLALAFALALGFPQGALAEKYHVTVTNNLADELLAPIVVTDTKNDHHFFTGNYVTEAAESQILTGDPAMIVKAIGMMEATVAHGMAGPPGVLLAPMDSISFEVETDAKSLRVLAMVAPTMVPDNYVTNVVDIHASDTVTVELNRFDIGHDEKTMINMMRSNGGATVTIEKAM